MKKIRIKLKNCYGIGSLEHEFDFESSRAYSIYAPNGFMKTSLSRTFFDVSKNHTSQDMIFPERITERRIVDENGNDLEAEKIFAIKPYDKDFSSEKTSLLLVNDTIKQTYDDALREIDKKKDILIKKLKQLSGLTGRNVTPESELLQVFGKNSFFELMESIAQTVQESGKNERLAALSYSELFNEKTIAFLQTGAMRTQLQAYIENYNALVERSPILCKSFNHYHALTVNRNLDENGFFTAQHTVNLFNGKDKEEVVSAKDLEAKIESEKQRILEDPELSKKFDAIDNKLKNAELRKFRDYLFDNKDVVSELAEYSQLQKSIWIAYLNDQKELFDELLSEYHSGKLVIGNAITTAKNEQTKWENVVALFNERFTVPFVMKVTNQDDVILKKSAPQISFEFKDSIAMKPVNQGELLGVLSQGEKRALYILNIMFELNARRETGIETLLVIDDIADSFDYKNKYAIVEYLKDLTESNDFFSLFLTHNFDFHRTIRSRLNIGRSHCLCTEKSGGNLELIEAQYMNDPFITWKKTIDNPKKTIACIPFVRNIADYCGHAAEFQKLTSLLHIKTDTAGISVADLQAIFISILKDKNDLQLPDSNKKVIDLIWETADNILVSNQEHLQLEEKIVLSIAIRMKAENYMILKISDSNFVQTISKNQTAKLVKRFKSDFATDVTSIRLLEQVNLMTPENIHLNSFMYEPILDMSGLHLKKLYRSTKMLNV